MWNTAFRIIYSIYFVVVSFLLFLIVSFLALITYFFFGRKRHEAYARWGKVWAKASLLCVGLYPKLSGDIPRRDAGPYIYVFNHQSQLDILLALAVLPSGFLFVAKEELFKVPLLGASMRRCGYIPIKRTNSRKAQQTLEELKQRVYAGKSILIFPEGTRSVTGALGPIKRGSIMIAFETQTPLLPVAINPAYRIMPKGSLFLQPQHIKVKFGAPLRFDWTNTNRDYTIACAAAVEQTLKDLLQTIPG